MDDGSKARLLPKSTSSGSEYLGTTDSEAFSDAFTDSRDPSYWTPSETNDETDDDPVTIVDNYESKRGSRIYSFQKTKSGKERLVCQK